MSTPTATSEPPGTSSVGGALPPALSMYIDAQISAIRDGDAALRRGEDPIHPTRVAIRRLRSTVRVFRDAFDPEFAARLDKELFWYAGILGHVRDHEVQRERFARAVAELPTEWVIGPVGANIDATLGAEQRVYRANVDVVLAGDRYAALLDTVNEISRRGRSVKKKRVV